MYIRKYNNPFLFTLILAGLLMGCKTGSKNELLIISENFEVGKKYDLEIQRERMDSRNPTSGQLSISTQVTMEAEEETTFKECAWKYGKTHFTGIGSRGLNKNTEQSVDYKSGLTLKFLIDQDGSFRGLTNFDSCKDSLKNNLRAVYKRSMEGSTDQKINEVFQLMEPTFSNPVVFLETYFPEINIFFGQFGDTLKFDSLYSSNPVNPSPLDGSMPEIHEVKIVKKSDKNTAIITIQQNTLGDATAFTNGIIQRNFSSLKLSGDSIGSVRINNAGQYFYEFKIHKLISAFRSKTAEIDSIKQEEKIKVIRTN